MYGPLNKLVSLFTEAVGLTKPEDTNLLQNILITHKLWNIVQATLL
jgi:hypothetical protein